MASQVVELRKARRLAENGRGSRIQTQCALWALEL